MFKTGFFLLFFYASLLWSQNITLKGTVTRADNHQALAGADIMVNELNAGTSSDSTGYYSLLIPKAGRFLVTASCLGYRSARVRLSFRPGEKTVWGFALQPEILQGQTIVVSATRAKERATPVTFSNLTAKDISQNYTASDIPLLLNTLPNTYSYSLTGDELGYSFLKIRGFDQKRIGVMINDIPLNDPEDQQVYWVDMPDFAESIQDIQVQRGVGSSTYGASTFGGSVNIKTAHFTGSRSISARFGFGSFGTRKFSVQYKSGLVGGVYAFYGRFSKIISSGFRDNSASDLWAYYLGAARYTENTVTTFNLYGGQEITHPDWYGIPQDILRTNRTYNQSSYHNDVDNFMQPHYELNHQWKISDKAHWENNFFYIRGEGYYENLKTAKKLRAFGMENFFTSDPTLFGADSLRYYRVSTNHSLLLKENGLYTVTRTDLVRRKWVKKNQLGAISRLHIKTHDGESTLGLSGYLFDSNHYGKVIWAKNLPAVYSPDRKYYKNRGNKKTFSAFFNYLYNYSPKLKLFSNLLYEYKHYRRTQQPTALFRGALLNAYRVEYNFLSPRLGLNYLPNKRINIYGNLSFAQREPADDDLYDTWQGPDDLGAPPLFTVSDTTWQKGRVQRINWRNPYIKPETLTDFELGFKYRSTRLAAAVNFYWMDFRNEIVALGGVDKDGNPIKGNAESSIHSGIELSVNTRLNSIFGLNGNFSYSKNYFKRFIQNNKNWETGETVPTDLSGNAIAGFPGMIGNLQLTARYRKFYAALSGRYVGKQYLDNTQNEQRRIGAYGTVNALLSYPLPTFIRLPQFELLFKVLNLFDARYQTAGYYDDWTGMNYYWPAAGRHFYAGVKVTL